MSDVDQELVPDETVIYRTTLHPVVMLPACAVGASLFVAGLLFTFQPAVFLDWMGRATGRGNFPAAPSFKFVGEGLVFMVVALGVIAAAWWRRNATELAVTNRRVVAKTGIVMRRTLELLLPKVESIEVDQSLWGRLLGFGTVVVRGTGGTPEPLALIDNPLEFRRQVQAQIDAQQPQRAAQY